MFLFTRIKVIKDLILTHLQNIYDATQQQLRNDAVLIEKHSTLIQHTSSLLENDINLLHASKAIIELLQQQLKESRELQVQLTQQIEYLQQLQEECRDFLKPKYLLDKNRIVSPETALSAHLCSFLPHQVALDVGANVGEFSEHLLNAGYEVYAFEPFPPVLKQLQERLDRYPNFHSFQTAIGATDTTMDLHLVSCKSNEINYDDPSVYSTLKPHAMPEGLEYTETIQVPVQSLESLHRSQQIPAEVGLVKIDTEGFDVEVIRGMGEFKYPVVITEFWTKHHIFWEPGQEKGGSLDEIVREMRQRQYYWYVVICRDATRTVASFHCNHTQTPERAWGNAFFFQSYEIFIQAVRWCMAVLPQTYTAQ